MLKQTSLTIYCAIMKDVKIQNIYFDLVCEHIG